MKHLKLFEGYFDRFYFKNPDIEDLNDTIDLSQKNFRRINDALQPSIKAGVVKKINWSPYPTPDEEDIYLDMVEVLASTSERDYTLIISELRDDWFTVEIYVYKLDKIPSSNWQKNVTYMKDESAFYSCDGFDGLVKLLEDLDLIKK